MPEPAVSGGGSGWGAPLALVFPWAIPGMSRMSASPLDALGDVPAQPATRIAVAMYTSVRFMGSAAAVSSLSEHRAPEARRRCGQALRQVKPPLTWAHR